MLEFGELSHHSIVVIDYALSSLGYRALKYLHNSWKQSQDLLVLVLVFVGVVCVSGEFFRFEAQPSSSFFLKFFTQTTLFISSHSLLLVFRQF